METKVPNAPITGKGSPAGPRWFVSKNPSLVLEVIPQYYPNEETGEMKKHIRVAFKSEEKPWTHKGEGKLGSRNKRGSDSNASEYYGVYFVIDPGPKPEGGYKDDVEAPKDDKGREHEDWRRTAGEKADDRHIIDHIRGRVYAYRNSPQDNKYRVTARLVELNWDPRELTIAAMQLAEAGPGRAASRPDEVVAEGAETGRVADMSGNLAKVVVKANR